MSKSCAFCGRLTATTMSSLFRRSLASRLRSQSHPFATSHAPRKLRPLSTISLVLLLSGTGYALGSIYPPSAISLLFPRPAPPPLDPNSDEAAQYLETLEEQLQSLPLLQSLRNRPDKDSWYESRPYTNFPEEVRVNHLLAGSLRGPGKLGIRPVAIVKNDNSEAIFFVHLGRALCGHDGVIHGGLLATLLDETLARVAIPSLPDKVGVTATLDVRYKAPTMADQFVVIKTALKEAKGRKSWVHGRLEDLDGKLLVEADGMFVQPRYAKLLKNNALLKQMVRTEDGAKNNPVATLT